MKKFFPPPVDIRSAEEAQGLNYIVVKMYKCSGCSVCEGTQVHFIFSEDVTLRFAATVAREAEEASRVPEGYKHGN